MSLKIMSAQNNGFSLVELLLVVTISALLVTTTIQVFDSFTKREVNILAGQHILRVQNAAEEYVSANFTDLWTNDIPNLGDTFEITTNTLSIAGFLPANFNNVNTFKQSVTTYIINAGNNFTGGETIEVVSISENVGAADNSFPNERVINAAQASGPKVGVVVQIDTGANCCENSIQSYSGAWSLPLGTLNGPAAWTAVAARPDSGYLAAYGRVAFSTTFNGDFLYRVSIAGQPELNRMETNIDMANNNITGVGVAAADNVTVGYAYDPATGLYSDRVVGGAGTGDITINGQQAGTGNFTPFGLSVDNALQASDGDSSFGFRQVPGACELNGAGVVTTGASTACAGGDLVMNNGSLTLDRLTLGAGLPGTPSFFGSQTMTVEDITDANRNFTANLDDTTVSGTTTTNDLTAFVLDASAAGTFTTPSLQASGGRFVQNIIADNVIAGEVRNINVLDAAGNVVVEGDIQSTGNLNTTGLNASTTFVINNMVGCYNDVTLGWTCP